MAEEKTNQPAVEQKTEAKAGVKKKVEVQKKEKAIARGTSLRISPVYSIAICRVIMGKTPAAAIKRLEESVTLNRAIPMERNETAHKHGMSGGKYAVNTCKEIIKLIKQLEANANVAGIENPIISLAVPNKGQRPFRRGGRKGKRTNIYLEATEKVKLLEKKK